MALGEWDALTTVQKRQEYRNCYGSDVFRENKLTLCEHTLEHEDQSYFIADWFRSYGANIAAILMDEDEQYEGPNTAAAQACLDLPEALAEMGMLAEILLKKKAA